MKTKDVKKIIQQFAKEEFVLYPESFPHNGGTITKCGINNISQWAIYMWESRNDEEIERDFRLGLHVDNYIVWTFEEFRKSCL